MPLKQREQIPYLARLLLPVAGEVGTGIIAQTEWVRVGLGVAGVHQGPPFQEVQATHQAHPQVKEIMVVLIILILLTLVMEEGAALLL